MDTQLNSNRAGVSPCLKLESSTDVCEVDDESITDNELHLKEITASGALAFDIERLRNLRVLKIEDSPAIFQSNIFSKFDLSTSLETLDLRFCKQSNTDFQFLTRIWKLTTLRTLCLFGISWENSMLPDEIGNLVNLESLQVAQSTNLKELTAHIGRLTKLRHLSISMCPNLENLPAEVGNLNLLQTLDLDMCSRLNLTKFFSQESATGLADSLRVVRVTHNLQLNQSSSPFQQTASLAKLCQFLAKCRHLVALDLKGNEIGNFDGFMALADPNLQTTSKLRVINFTENPIIYHSLQNEDTYRLIQLLTIHHGLGSFGGDEKNIDKVVDAIVLRHWTKNPRASHLQDINRVGRPLIMKNHQSRYTTPLSLWPKVFARASCVYSKYRAKKRTANAIYYLLRNNPELIGGIGIEGAKE